MFSDFLQGCVGCRIHASPVTAVSDSQGGYVGCRINASPVTAVADSLGAVWAANPRVTRDSSF